MQTREGKPSGAEVSMQNGLTSGAGERRRRGGRPDRALMWPRLLPGARHERSLVFGEIQRGNTSMLPRVSCRGNGRHNSLLPGVFGWALMESWTASKAEESSSETWRFFPVMVMQRMMDNPLHCSSLPHSGRAMQVFVPAERLIGWSVPTWQSLIGWFSQHCFLWSLKTPGARNKITFKDNTNTGVFFYRHCLD